MRTSATNSLIEHLRLSVSPPDGAVVGDGVLLSRFVERHDEAAFAALVHRHGPMVWGVCRRLLNRHDAEDAFQATFLVLARKAGSVRSRESAGNWLYGVAHQTALHARRTAARRRAKEVQVATMPDTEAAGPDPWADLQPLLDEELSRLPDIYRTVIVLCDLEGRTRKEVAHRLGVPEGTVAGRIARARTLLARRLTRRGVALSGGALAAVLTQRGASAGVPNTAVVSTIKAARLIAAGTAAGTGTVPVKVAALMEGVMKAMLFKKLKAAMAVVLTLGFVATGAMLLTDMLLTDRTAAGQDGRKPVAEKSVAPVPKQKEEDEFTAWGKEVSGLQAGLSISNRSDVRVGGKATAVVKLRNVSSETVTASAWPLWVTGPQVVDSDGNKVRSTSPPMPLFGIIPRKLTLKPGETVVMAKTNIFVVDAEAKDQPFPEGVVNQFTIHVRPGTYKADFRGFLKEHPTLATGTAEFTVKAEREGFTAWGKEVVDPKTFNVK